MTKDCYSEKMKLSQPKSARIINTCRVLNELRRNTKLSKSELARILDLNKVSTGEIVSALINQGIVRETGKLEVTNGRRPTTLEIIKDSRFVLCVDIGSCFITTALCNLAGETVKLERIPCNTDGSEEEFCAQIIKSCVRSAKLVEDDRILGIGITVSGKISLDEKTVLSCPYLPWQNIAIVDAFEKSLNLETVVSSSVSALVAAEKTKNAKALVSSQPVLYLDWGDHISLAIISSMKIAGVNVDFGRIPVSGTKTLEDYCASWAIRSQGTEKLKNLWDDIPEEALEYMAKALIVAQRVTGNEKVILGGESSTIDMSCLGRIRRECPKLIIEKSSLGEKANIVAAAESALDRFFYQSGVLDEVRSWI